MAQGAGHLPGGNAGACGGWGDTCPELCTRPGLTHPSSPPPAQKGNRGRWSAQKEKAQAKLILWFPAAQSHPQSLTEKHATTLAQTYLPSWGHTRGPALCARGIAGASSCLPWNLQRGAGGASTNGVRPSTARPAPRRPLALPRQPTYSQQELNNLFSTSVLCPWFPGLAGHCSGANRPADRSGGCCVGRVPPAVRAATLLPQRVPGAVRGRARGPPIET